MINFLLIIIGKFLSLISNNLNLGNGSTWPGHIALSINKNYIREIIKVNPQLKIILIAGTNGKTTTGKLIQAILEGSGKKVFQNESGANLLNGIASSIMLHSNILCKIKYNYAIFEVDENTVSLILKECNPDYLILLNLFRDQLDRYGEVNTIANKWEDSIRHLPSRTTLILNADDPQIAFLGFKNESSSLGANVNPPGMWNRSVTSVFYFGLNDKKLAITQHQHAVDSTFCPNCSSKLHYDLIYYSHLGDWKCEKCGYKRPKNILSTFPQSKLTGTYNLYNILAATLVAKKIAISDDTINKSLKTFVPAFGRQEILNVNGKKVQIFLSKNPTSFNESLRTVSKLGAKHVLLVLNDRIPDGCDVSWIWDVDFEDFVHKLERMFVSGDRTYDLALRIKYATQSSNVKTQNYNSKLKTYENLEDAIRNGVSNVKDNETLYILPTYSAMLEARKILTGKKIL